MKQLVIEPTTKELRHILRVRKIAEIDKKITPYAWLLLTVIILSAVVCIVGAAIAYTPPTYILDSGQTLQIKNDQSVTLDGVKLIAEETTIPSQAPLIIPFAILGTLSFVGMVSLGIYEWASANQVENSLLESCLSQKEELK